MRLAVTITGDARRRVRDWLGWCGVAPDNVTTLDREMVIDEMQTHYEYMRSRGLGASSRRPATQWRVTPALEAVWNWTADPARTPVLAISGGYGASKTLAMARAVATAPMGRPGAHPLLVGEHALLRALRDPGPLKGGTATAGDLVRTAERAPLLAIDEVMREDHDAPEWKLRPLLDLLSRRYTNGLHTLLAANPVQGVPNPFQRRLGGRLWDRWSAGRRSIHVVVKTTSLRQDARVRAAVERYREQVARAYDEPASRPLTDVQQAELRAAIARMKRNVEANDGDSKGRGDTANETGARV